MTAHAITKEKNRPVDITIMRRKNKNYNKYMTKNQKRFYMLMR